MSITSKYPMEILQISIIIAFLLLALVYAHMLTPVLKEKIFKYNIERKIKIHDAMMDWIDHYVQLAEYKFKGHINSGPKKKYYVASLVERKAAGYNININEESLDADIEYAVAKMKKSEEERLKD